MANFVHGDGMPLTDTWLKANEGKEREKTLEVADRDGMGVRVSPKGKMTFQLRYRYAGKAARVDLGTYPMMGLKAARMEAQRLRGQLETGHDPRVVVQLEKHKLSGAIQIETMIRQWYAAYCVANKKNHAEILRSFEIYIFPKLGSLPAELTTIPLWLDILEPIAKKYPGIADRLLINSKQAYKWAIRRSLVDLNPLASITGAADLNIRKGQGTRTLDDDELRHVWRAINESRMLQKNRLFLRLVIFYGCRNGELRLARKEHFNFKDGVWTVPPENHKTGKKTGKALLRPIIPEVRPLIEEAMMLSAGPFLFTNAESEEGMGPRVPLALPYNIMQWLRKNDGFEMGHWSVHDLRRTARTNFSKITNPLTAEIMLGHKLPGVWEVYDRYNYLGEQAVAYSSWWARLMQIVEA